MDSDLHLSIHKVVSWEYVLCSNEDLDFLAKKKKNCHSTLAAWIEDNQFPRGFSPHLYSIFIHSLSTNPVISPNCALPSSILYLLALCMVENWWDVDHPSPSQCADRFTLNLP